MSAAIVGEPAAEGNEPYDGFIVPHWTGCMPRHKRFARAGFRRSRH